MEECDIAAAAAFAVCFLLHHVVSPLVCPRFIPRYSELPWAMRMEWNSRIVSSVHATVTALLSALSLAIGSQLWMYPIFGTLHLAKVTLGLSVGYMVCDIVSMPVYYRGMDLYVYLAHHSISALAFFISMKYEVLIFFAMYRLTSEFSTPFANQRWFYLNIGSEKRSSEVLINTWLFALLFFVFRNLCIPGYWFMVFRACRSHHFTDLIHSLPVAGIVWIFSSVLLDLLNLYWAHKVIPKGYRITLMALSKTKSR